MKLRQNCFLTMLASTDEKIFNEGTLSPQRSFGGLDRTFNEVKQTSYTISHMRFIHIMHPFKPKEIYKIASSAERSATHLLLLPPCFPYPCFH
jgi:hypothetical protein